MKKQKLAIIGTVGVPAAYGGFETLVEQLLVYLEEDFEVTVYCSGTFYPKQKRLQKIGNTTLKYIPLGANGISSIPYDMISILHAAFTADIFLILGVSGCVLLPVVKFFTKKKAYVNIDGIEWKRDKWNPLIKAFLRYSEIAAVESAEGIITDNKVIQDYLKQTYDYQSYLIEYGGDQAIAQPVTNAFLEKYPFLKKPYAFSVCRIEPENNIHLILEAMVTEDYLNLVFIGNWEKSAYGQALKEKYSEIPHFYLLDPIYEPIELNTLRSNCYVYLHGHSAGGTNPSIVEAMNLGLAIVAFDVMYNRESTENEALFFSNTQELQNHIRGLHEAKRKAIAQRMLEIGKRRYTWKVIAQKYTQMMSPQKRKKSTLEKSKA